MEARRSSARPQSRGCRLAWRHRAGGRRFWPLGLIATGALYYVLQNGVVDVYWQSIDLSRRAETRAPMPVSPTLVGANMSSEWSPDGRYLAYVSMRGLVPSDRYSQTLVLREIESGEQPDLRPALAGFIEPRWSPDGRRILVGGTDLLDREGIFTIDIDSGRTQPALLFPPDRVQSATYQWSPDGNAVWYDKSDTGAIVAHDLASGRESVVVDYRKDSIQYLMQWPGFRVSPDGNSIAYTGFTFQDNAAGTVVVVRAMGGASLEIARATTPERVEFEDWTPDGRGLLVIKRNTKERSNGLFEVRLDGSPAVSLGISAPAMRDVSVRRDGGAITYTAGANSTEVWVLENLLFSASVSSVRDR